MAKFIFKTHRGGLTTYDGPSGKRYTIDGHLPFEVKIPMDIEFFSSKRHEKRFEKVGFFSQTTEQVTVSFEEELGKVPKLSKKTIDRIVKVYGNLDTLVKTVERKYTLDSEIAKGQVEIITKYILEGKMEEEKKIEDQEEEKEEKPSEDEESEKEDSEEESEKEDEGEE